MAYEQRHRDADIWGGPQQKKKQLDTHPIILLSLSNNNLHIYIHLFNKYLWSDYYVLHTSDSVANKTDGNSYLHRASILVEDNRK